LLLCAVLLALPGCVIKRTASEKDIGLSTFHGIGVTYARERTNSTTLFSIGLIQLGHAHLIPVKGAARTLDINPLNVQPKVP